MWQIVSEDSMLGKVAEEEYSKVNIVRITKETDFSLRRSVDTMLECIKKSLGWSIHASLHCTVCSQWQWMNHEKNPPSPQVCDNASQLH